MSEKEKPYDILLKVGDIWHSWNHLDEISDEECLEKLREIVKENFHEDKCKGCRYLYIRQSRGHGYCPYCIRNPDYKDKKEVDEK